jgi:hypothetical protein
MDTSQTLQQTMFPQDEARSGIVSGAANSRAQLESELKLARVTGNKQAADLAIEQLRELQARGDKEAEPISALGDTRDLQEAFGSKLPQNVQRLQAASDARARSYAEMVSILDRFNKGKAKQAELDTAETQVYASLISEIEALRGEPVTATERTQITADAEEQVQEMKSRFGDTRDMVEVDLGGGRVLVSEDSRLAQGAVPGTERGVARKESRPPGRRTFSTRYAAAKSIEEALNDIRNRFVGPAKKQNIERTTFRVLLHHRYASTEEPRCVVNQSPDIDLHGQSHGLYVFQAPVLVPTTNIEGQLNLPHAQLLCRTDSQVSRRNP